jgi:hypothetical protein
MLVIRLLVVAGGSHPARRRPRPMGGRALRTAPGRGGLVPPPTRVAADGASAQGLLPAAALLPARNHESTSDTGAKDLTHRLDLPAPRSASPVDDVLSVDDERIAGKHGGESVESDFLLVSPSLPFRRGPSYERAVVAAAEITARLPA